MSIDIQNILDIISIRFHAKEREMRAIAKKMRRFYYAWYNMSEGKPFLTLFLSMLGALYFVVLLWLIEFVQRIYF